MRSVRVLFRHNAGTSPGIAGRLDDLNLVFGPADLSFESGGAATADGLASVDVTGCDEESDSLTGDQQGLFDQVSVQEGEVAVFLADAVGGANGCASHPDDKPGLVALADAKRWVLAHEVGHVLGLSHQVGSTLLMRSNPSGLSTSTAPRLSEEDFGRLAGSSIPQEAFAPALVTADVAEAPQGARPKPKPRARPKAKRGRAAATQGIAALTADALSSLSRRRSPDVIDRVAGAIADHPAFKRRYRSLVRTHGRAAVHSGIGRHVRQLTGMASSGQTRAGTSLLATYSVLRR